jgi:hypothetical protein
VRNPSLGPPWACPMNDPRNSPVAGCSRQAEASGTIATRLRKMGSDLRTIADKERQHRALSVVPGPVERAWAGLLKSVGRGGGRGRIGGCERRHRCPKLDGLSSPCLSSPKGSTVPVVSPIPPFATTGTVPFIALDLFRSYSQSVTGGGLGFAAPVSSPGLSSTTSLWTAKNAIKLTGNTFS